MNKPLPNRQSIRLKNYDYSKPGYYFVTICTQDRIYRFGKIIDEKMRVNDAGEIVADEWIIMPNHFHAIITVGARCTRPNNDTRPLADNGRDDNGRMQSAPTGVVLGDVVRGFKSSVTKRVLQLPDMNDIKLW